jgi:hypothetical protein
VNRNELIERIYSGKFVGHSGSVQITLNGNKPVATFRGDFANYLAQCGAHVGQLTWLRIGGNAKTGYLSQAIFEYYEGHCTNHDGVALNFKQGSRGPIIAGSFFDEGGGSGVINDGGNGLNAAANLPGSFGN